MVIENISLNSSEIFSGLIENITPKLNPLITIFKALGIALLVYVLFLIIRVFLNLKAALRIKDIAKNVEEINNKLDIIVNKLGSKKVQKKSEEKNVKKIKKIKSFCLFLT